MNEFGVFVGPESIGLAAVGEYMLGISKIAVDRQRGACLQDSLEGDGENVGSECCGRIKGIGEF